MQDFDDIASIQSELAIAFQLLASGVRESSTGFLISAYKAENFRDFIQQGGLILGARQAERGRLIGYLLGNSGQTFRAHHPTTQLHWDSAHTEEQYGPLYSSGRFTYLDQIGVRQSFHGSGVAQQLHRCFLEFSSRPILAAVVQEPIRNTRSTMFFKKLGYRQIGTFYTAELKGLRDVRSAVLALPEDMSRQ
jgi:hypothetical protein